MTVKPASVIAYIRETMLQKNLVSQETFQRFSDLLHKFQRVRRHGVLTCLKNEKLTLSKKEFDELLDTPIAPSDESIMLDFSSESNDPLLKALKKADTASCFTCAGCSSSCPVFYERALFEPQSIFRMANLGLTKQLFASPSLWLCIDCRRCTDNCSQLVKGHETIESLRALAIKEGAVPASFASRLLDMEKVIYPYLLDEIDALLDLSQHKQGQTMN